MDETYAPAARRVRHVGQGYAAFRADVLTWGRGYPAPCHYNLVAWRSRTAFRLLTVGGALLAVGVLSPGGAAVHRWAAAAVGSVLVATGLWLAASTMLAWARREPPTPVMGIHWRPWNARKVLALTLGLVATVAANGMVLLQLSGRLAPGSLVWLALFPFIAMLLSVALIWPYRMGQRTTSPSLGSTGNQDPAPTGGQDAGGAMHGVPWPLAVRAVLAGLGIIAAVLLALGHWRGDGRFGGAGLLVAFFALGAGVIWRRPGSVRRRAAMAVAAGLLTAGALVPVLGSSLFEGPPEPGFLATVSERWVPLGNATWEATLDGGGPLFFLASGSSGSALGQAPPAATRLEARTAQDVQVEDVEAEVGGRWVRLEATARGDILRVEDDRLAGAEVRLTLSGPARMESLATTVEVGFAQHEWCRHVAYDDGTRTESCAPHPLAPEGQG